MSVFLLVQAGTYIRNGPRLALIDLRRVGGGKRDPRSYMHVSRGAIGEVTDITDIQTEKIFISRHKNDDRIYNNLPNPTFK